MAHTTHRLRTRLFLFYLVSLIVLAIFFYAAVHIYMVPYNTELFFGLLFILAIIGFFLIRRITGSLANLTEQIQLISSHNLDRHIIGIKSKDEIGELSKSFNELLERLSQAFKREQQFIADVAHEMKTPLATQRSAIEVTLAKERTKEGYKTALEEALRENNHLSSTLKNVLDLAWSETPIEQKNAVQINLSELMEELYDIAVKISIQTKISVDKSIQGGIFIVGFKDKLARALINVIDNAVKYTPSEGHIFIELVKVYNKAVITIKDTGQGINEEEIPHIFDRFYRGSSTDKVFGSGLGLAITKSVIMLHHGHIKVESTVGKGTAFTLTLPIKSTSS